MRKLLTLLCILCVLAFATGVYADTDVDLDSNTTVDSAFGGTNRDTSGDTGYPYITAGVWSAVTSVTSTVTVLDDSDIAGDNISAAQARRGVIITNDGKGGAADYNILAGTKGDMIYVFAEEAAVITLDLADSDDIITLIDGTALTAGNAIDSDGNAGSSITLICHDGDGGTAVSYWYVHSQVGAWVDGGAN